MDRRRLAVPVALALSLACNFDPSGATGGPGGGIGGERDDGGAGASDARPAIDAAPPIDATPLCRADCPGSCDEAGVCHIECGPDGDGGGLLPEDPPPCGAVTCPPGTDCYVHCVGQDACQQPIDCSQASACRIDCTDDRSCAAQLTCGAGPCEVHCDGSESCTGGLSCQSSCFCDVSCTGDSSCDPQVVCPPGCDADPECKTSGAGCADSC